MKTKGKNSLIFTVCTLAIIALAVLGFSSFEIGGYKVKSFNEAITKGLDLQGGVSVLLEIKDDISDSDELQKTLDKTKQLIELRVNKLGVAETIVTVEGDKRIRVDIPGASNSNDIAESLTKTGNLTFKSPEGEVILTGKEHIKEASTVINQETGKPEVLLKLNDEGTKIFAEATAKYVGQQISIYMDDEMVSNPTVQTTITAGEATITGSGSMDEATNLTGIINSGALPVTMNVASMKTVGAQLGAEAFPNAVKAGVVGIGLIFIFMVVYYRRQGVIAILALTLYITTTLFAFVEVGVTLTLPGIAAFLLTVGMAMDANILIFERVREEIAKGVSVKTSIKRGFENALSSIIDSNVTTMITALVLYFLGSGAVKGFAVTLMIGIVVSLFTALLVTKILMNSAAEIGLLSKPSHFRVKRGEQNV
ncbi:MAG: protein translocase subunit SecD [Clostridium sp.]